MSLSTDPYAPKPGRKRGNHDFGVVDMNDRVPDFIRHKNPLVKLADELGVAIDKGEIPAMSAQEDPRQLVGEHDYDDPPEPVAPLEGLLLLMRKLTYGDMMWLTGQIVAKIPDLDQNKLATALHAVATQEPAK